MLFNIETGNRRPATNHLIPVHSPFTQIAVAMLGIADALLALVLQKFNADGPGIRCIPIDNISIEEKHIFLSLSKIGKKEIKG